MLKNFFTNLNYFLFKYYFVNYSIQSTYSLISTMKYDGPTDSDISNVFRKLQSIPSNKVCSFKK